MAILETKKGTAFYKTGPLYQQAEADRKAKENLQSSTPTIESQNVTKKRGKDDRGTYTDYITEKNIKNTGTGESTSRPSYEAYKASGGNVAEAKKWWAEQAKNKLETSTRRVYDKIESIKLDPMPLQPLTNNFNFDPIKPDFKLKEVEKPQPNLSLSGGSYKKARIGKPDLSLNTRFSNKKSGKCPAGRKCKGAVN